jgi:hypothetical protein
MAASSKPPPAHVNIANDVRVTTAAPTAHRHLADRPAGFHHRGDRRQHLGRHLVGAAGHQQRDHQHDPAGPATPTTGNGDIFVNDAVAWTASGVPTTLTLNAFPRRRHQPADHRPPTAISSPAAAATWSSTRR